MRDALVTNKPNFRLAGPQEHAIAQNEPIARSGAPRRCLDCALRIGHSVRRDDNCAKQSQFGQADSGRRGRVCRTKPIRRAARQLGGQRYKQSQSGGRRRSCETKPIPATVSGGAKALRKGVMVNSTSGGLGKQRNPGNPASHLHCHLTGSESRAVALSEQRGRLSLSCYWRKR